MERLNIIGSIIFFFIYSTIFYPILIHWLLKKDLQDKQNEGWL